jgi:hypothetical protein
VYDAVTGRPAFPFNGHHGGPKVVGFTSDGTSVVTTGSDNITRVWDTTTGRHLGVVPRPDIYLPTSDCAALTPDGTAIAESEDDLVVIRRLSDGRELARLAGQDGSIRAIAISPDGTQLVTSGTQTSPRTTTVRQWDLTTGRAVRVLRQGQFSTGRLVFSPDGSMLVSNESGSQCRVWDLAAGTDDARPMNGRNGLACATDGKTLIAVGDDHEARIYDPRTGATIRKLGSLDHPDLMATNRNQFVVAFSADRRLLAWVGDQNCVHVWELASGQDRCSFAQPGGRMGRPAFSPDGRRLVTGSNDTTAYVWDVTGLAVNGALSRLDLTPARLADLWADLANADAARAATALWTLVAGAEAAVPYLRDRLIRSPPDPAKLARWIADLDSDQFVARQAASRELEGAGEAVEAALSDAATIGQSAEARRRARQLLDKLRDREKTPTGLRELRAVEVLEHIATPAAREQIKVLAGGAPGATLTRAASEAIKRLGPVSTGR